MSSNPLSTFDKVSIAQMRSAIKRAGYLLEQRVEGILRNKDYLVETNPSFLDPDTGKSRELDIKAETTIDLDLRNLTKPFALCVSLLCECENNTQPVVFFTRESLAINHCRESRAEGIPVLFWRTGTVPTSLAEFAGMHRFHHKSVTNRF